MADKKISQLTAAAALTGSEPIPTVQGGVTVQTTAQAIADLAGANAIPLTGTEAGSPVTGIIESASNIMIVNTQSGIAAVIGSANTTDVSNSDYGGVLETLFGESGAYSKICAFANGKAAVIEAKANTTTGLNYINVDINDSQSPGIKGEQDFSPNINDLDYTQKKYVDNTIIALDYGGIVDVGGVQNIQVYTTGTGTGTASVDLSPTIQIGKDVTVSDLANNAGTYNIQIDAGIGNTILVAGSAPSQDITLSTNGASITLRKITSTQFMVISKL